MLNVFLDGADVALLVSDIVRFWSGEDYGVDTLQYLNHSLMEVSFTRTKKALERKL